MLKRLCGVQGCGNGTTDRFCAEHQPIGETYMRYDPEVRKLYNNRWRKYRKMFLQKHPLCAEHSSRGLVVAANAVDHIVPHRGDYLKFWDSSNHQSLCTECHNAKSGREVLHRGIS